VNKTKGNGRLAGIHVHYCQEPTCGTAIDLLPPAVYVHTRKDQGYGTLHRMPRDPFPIVEVYCAA